MEWKEKRSIVHGDQEQNKQMRHRRNDLRLANIHCISVV